MLGLRRGSVQIVAYNPAWATLFEAERARLHHSLHPDALDIQHIGSTAVPGLAAKPILDLGTAVADEAIVTACVPRLTALGYAYRGYRGADQGHFFDLGPEHHLTHYLHMLLIAIRAGGATCGFAITCAPIRRPATPTSSSNGI